MMLPSGNDSALCLAENIGLIQKIGAMEFKKRLVTYQQIFENSETMDKNHGL